LKGSTHDEFGYSADIFRSVTLPLLQKLGVANDEDSQLSFKIVTRSYGESADGCVIFTCPIVKFIPPIDLTKEGLVKRVRGVFWSAKMNREFSVRFVESARSILNKCIEDVWVYTENVKNSTEPVYGASIMSETEYGFFKGINCLSKSPEEADKLGKRLAKQLLREIDAGGIADESHQWLVCLFMALSQDHKVSKALVSSELSENTIEFLRGIQNFLLVRFNLTRVVDTDSTEDSEDEKNPAKGQIQLECIGINMTNTARKAL
jgi:RNA 3'-terminal phosphate cyclase-like protein